MPRGTTCKGCGDINWQCAMHCRPVVSEAFFDYREATGMGCFPAWDFAGEGSRYQDFCIVLEGIGRIVVGFGYYGTEDWVERLADYLDGSLVSLWLGFMQEIIYVPFLFGTKPYHKTLFKCNSYYWYPMTVVLVQLDTWRALINVPSGI